MTKTALSRWTDSVKEYDIPHLRLRQVASLVQLEHPRRMVDLGCATGTLGRLCPDIDYVGCDFVQPTIQQGFTFYRCDFNSELLPPQVQGEDLIVCSGLLEYIEDIPHFLQQVHQRLRREGVFIATYFNMNHIRRLWTLLRGRSFMVHPDWRGFHSPRAMMTLLVQNGFTLEKMYVTSHSLNGSPAVGATVNDSPFVELPRFHIWSYFLGHQVIFVSRKKNCSARG